MAKNQVIAIDVGTTTAKIVHIEKVSGALRLINAGVIAYTDRNSPESVLAAVQELWNRLGIKRNIFNKHKLEVAIALPRGLIVTKRLSNLPATTQDAMLPSLIEIAAETELPFPIEEAIFTYHGVRRTPEAISVELVSTRRETVERYMETLSGVDASLSAVVPSMLAVAASAGNALAGRLQRTIVVDIGAGRTDFCLMEGSDLLFSRSFAMGGDQLTEHLMAEAQLDAETAEQEKQVIPAHQFPTRTWTTQLVAELERSIAAAKREIPNDAEEWLAEIWLCGGGARVPELAEACHEQLRIPTRHWHLRNTVVLDISPEAAPVFEEASDTFAVPLGSAIHLLTAETPVSLLPQEIDVKRVESNRKRQQLIAASIGGFLILGIALGSVTWSRSQNAKIAALDQEIANFVPLQANANKQLALELVLADQLAHQTSPLDVLHAISTLFKDRTKVAWKTFDITNLDDLEKARVSFNLEANSHEAINNMIDVLDQSKLFRNIEDGGVTTTGDERRPIFQVKVQFRLTREAAQLFAQKRHPEPVYQIRKPEPEEPDISPPPGDTSEKPEVDDESKEPEKPETDDEAKEPEKPEVDDESKEPEKPETDDEAKEPEKPEADDEAKEPEKPETDDEAKEPEVVPPGEPSETPKAEDENEKENEGQKE